MLQILSEKEILVIRSAYKKTADEAILYVISDTQYADDSTLLGGDYVCIGRYQYTNKMGFQKTVYALAEKSFYDNQMKGNAAIPLTGLAEKSFYDKQMKNAQ